MLPIDIVSPCKNCDAPAPPNCRKSCVSLKQFQETMEEIPQTAGGGQVFGFSSRRQAHE